MAKCVIKMVKNNSVKDVPIGFSWTTLFFGPFVPLFRGDWKWLGIMVIINFFVLGLSGVVFAFFYNKMYAKQLISAQWRVMSVPDTITDRELEEYLSVVSLPKS